jgi:hypothetical protein
MHGVPLTASSIGKRHISEEDDQRVVSSYLKAVRRTVLAETLNGENETVALPRKYICRLPVTDLDISRGEISISLHVPIENPGSYHPRSELKSAVSEINSTIGTSSDVTQLKCIGEVIGIKLSKLLQKHASVSDQQRPSTFHDASVVPLNQVIESHLALGLERHSLK